MPHVLVIDAPDQRAKRCQELRPRARPARDQQDGVVGRKGLERIIEATYVDSQDCPRLRGLRRMEDVVASHKASGIFRPQSWWIAAREGQPVGCVLVNDSAEDKGAAELVYLGVGSAHRRRGYGRAMLRHAMEQARRRGRKRMNVAVDSANAPAVRLYRHEGFRRTDQRDVYIKPPSPGP